MMARSPTPRSDVRRLDRFLPMLAGIVGGILVGLVAIVGTVRALVADDPGTAPAVVGAPIDVPAGCDGAPIRLRGQQESAYRNVDLAAGTVIDAREAEWSGVDADGIPIDWTITLDGAGGGCWLGGRWNGAWDDKHEDVSWEDPYHHAGLVTLRLPDFTVAGITGANHGDGIRVARGASGFDVVGVHLTDIHDDCIENDYMLAGTVRDSLLDGCYVAFSAARHSGQDDAAVDAVWELRGNVVRLEPQPTTYSGPSPGHGQLFKWTEGAPIVDIVDNVFRVDQPPNHGSLGLPDELRLGACSGNVVVWGGEGPYPDPLPDCFRVTTDLDAWTQAVSQWRRTHLPDECSAEAPASCASPNDKDMPWTTP